MPPETSCYFANREFGAIFIQEEILNSMKGSVSLAILLCLFGPLLLQAQPGQFPLIHYSTKDGLPHDQINCIFKDKEGFIWLGTSGGLTRFDGISFKVFRQVPGDIHSLPDNTVVGLSQDASGRIWVATQKGMSWLDPEDNRFHALAGSGDEEMRSPASRLVPDKLGNGWFALQKKIVKTDLESLEYTAFPIPDSLWGGDRILVDRKNNIWLETGGRICRFYPDDNSFRLYAGIGSREPGLDLPVGRMLEDQQGRLWSGSWGKGLIYYDEETDRFVDFPDRNNISGTLCRDRDHSGRPFFWIGGGVDGLYLLYPEEGRDIQMRNNPRDPYSHNGFMVSDIFRDEESGIIWLATEEGLEKYDPLLARFQLGLIPVDPDFSQFSLVSDVIQDRTDPSGRTYWIGVWGSGLFRWDRWENRFQRYYHSNKGLGNNEVFCIEQDKKGNLWIGQPNGIDIIDPRTMHRQRLEGFFRTPGINHKVLRLLTASNGDTWIGSNFEGLFCYHTGEKKLEHIVLCDSIHGIQGANRIAAIAEDEAHRIWVCTFNGVFRIDPSSGEVQPFWEVDGFPNRMQGNDLFVGRNGQVWIATQNGLLCMDLSGKLIRHYGQKDGLLSEAVTWVVQDEKGLIWMGTADRLHRLDPSTGEIDYFGKADGLISNASPSGLSMAGSGELFLGFRNAFNYFDPLAVSKNQRQPKVVITGLSVSNKEVPYQKGKEVVLRPGENILTFEFAALNFSQPEKNRFAYQLDGFDEEWVYTQHRWATYTNLDGGEYVFRVRAANNDGIWNESGITIPVRVIPPFYKTWYYWAVLVLLSLSLVGAILWYRHRQRIKVEGIRRHIARDLHDDMGSSLSSIRFFSQFALTKLESTPAEAMPIMERIGQTAATLSESMQDIIWAIDSDKDKLDDLVTKIREFGFRMLEVRQINFKVNITKGFRPARLTITQRRNIYLIFKEAVNNAIKYAECTEVRLFLTTSRNTLRMCIEDNGKGFDPDLIKEGHGLQNLKKRALEIGGVLEFQSAPGGGTKVILTTVLKG